MTVIGVLLIIVAVVLLLIGLLAGADADTTLAIGGAHISMSAMGVFLMGAATVLIFVSGLEMLRSGLRRSLRHRRELKEARAVVAEQERRGREGGAEPAAAGTTAPGATGETTGDTTGTAAAGTGEPPPATAPSATPGTAPGATPSTTPSTAGGAGTSGTTDTTTDVGGTGDTTDDPGRHSR